jgi:hypothetical protein
MAEIWVELWQYIKVGVVIYGIVAVALLVFAVVFTIKVWRELFKDDGVDDGFRKWPR